MLTFSNYATEQNYSLLTGLLSCTCGSVDVCEELKKKGTKAINDASCSVVHMGHCKEDEDSYASYR